MALLMVSEGLNPQGQYDLDVADGYTSLLGGEVFVLVSNGADANGFQTLSARPARTTDGYGPFFLGDDGTYGYGVLFGNTVTRTATGFSSGSDTGTRLGPGTWVGSGKVTLWDKPGLYAVSLDALDSAVTESTWKSKVPGTALTVKSDGSGKLTTVGAPTGFPPVASVVTYKVDEALVTTGGAVVVHKKLVVRFNPYAQIA